MGGHVPVDIPTAGRHLRLLLHLSQIPPSQEAASGLGSSIRINESNNECPSSVLLYHGLKARLTS